jgi:hypothetical protein
VALEPVSETQHACSLAQLVPVEVLVLVLVPVLLVVQTTGTHVPVPVGGRSAAFTQAERVDKQDPQIAPPSPVRWPEQFATHTSAVESQDGGFPSGHTAEAVRDALAYG